MEQIANFVQDYRQSHDYGPSVREISKGIGLNVSTTQRWIELAVFQGYIERATNLRCRTLRVPENREVTETRLFEIMEENRSLRARIEEAEGAILELQMRIKNYRRKIKSQTAKTT